MPGERGGVSVADKRALSTRNGCTTRLARLARAELLLGTRRSNCSVGGDRDESWKSGARWLFYTIQNTFQHLLGRTLSTVYISRAQGQRVSHASGRVGGGWRGARSKCSVLSDPSLLLWPMSCSCSRACACACSCMCACAVTCARLWKAATRTRGKSGGLP
jgi:hypothetical protein